MYRCGEAGDLLFGVLSHLIDMDRRRIAVMTIGLSLKALSCRAFFYYARTFIVGDVIVSQLFEMFDMGYKVTATRPSGVTTCPG